MASGGKTPKSGSSAQPAGPTAARTDRATARLVLFTALLALALIAGFGLGRSTGRSSSAVGAAPPAEAGAHTHAPGEGAHSHDGTTAPTASVGAEAGGLAVSSGGFTLVPEATQWRAGVAQPLRFRIQGRDGQPVKNFATVHDKPMHLIVVRRDLSGYQHLHPSLAPDGTWSTDLTLASPGPWRAYADFAAQAASGSTAAVTLGVDLVVAGNYPPQPLPAAAREAAVDGFTVGYEGTPQVAASQPLLFRITRNGAPATLEPYLGAFGHLVMLREGDLGYVHVHPEPGRAGDAVKFWLTAPSPGRYRMFLDFQVAGAVHTAAFTVTVGAGAVPTPG